MTARKKHTRMSAVAVVPRFTTNVVTKESLHKRVESARTAKQLDDVEHDARIIGYSKGGVLLTAVREKRASL